MVTFLPSTLFEAAACVPFADAVLPVRSPAATTGTAARALLLRLQLPASSTAVSESGSKGMTGRKEGRKEGTWCCCSTRSPVGSYGHVRFHIHASAHYGAVVRPCPAAPSLLRSRRLTPACEKPTQRTLAGGIPLLEANTPETSGRLEMAASQPPSASRVIPPSAVVGCGQ